MRDPQLDGNQLKRLDLFSCGDDHNAVTSDEPAFHQASDLRAMLKLSRNIDLAEGETIALTVACPNKSCAAPSGEICRPYTHWVRVRRALLALPHPVERDV